MDIPTEKLLESLKPLSKDYDQNSLDEIGQGNQGQVFKVKCRSDKKFYAVKKSKSIFKDKWTTKYENEEIFREIDNLRQLDHPNIAKIYEVVINKN